MTGSWVKKLIPHIAGIFIIVLVSIFYFYPQLEGRVLTMGDITSFKGMNQEVQEFKAETGETSLWTNSMFGGMPTYQMGSPQDFNVFKYFERAMNLGFSRPIGYFIFGAISFYLLMLILGVNPWLSLIGALLFSFCTNNIVLFEAGHTSKVRAIMSSPLILAGVISVFRKDYLIGFASFTLGMGINVYANHYQMTYYFGMIIMIMILIELVNTIREGEFGHIIKSGGIFLFGLIIALGASSAKLLPTFEYSKDTMRGSPILETAGVPTSSSETEGLEWNYAMGWSNGASDLFASFIPGVVGGSSLEKADRSSNFVKEFRKLGQTVDQAPLYWGGLPSTAGPAYFGAGLFFLFLFGMFAVQDRLKWGILAGIILTFIMSMGKNFEAPNRFMFDFFPYFAKFRTPNSVLSVTAVIMPLIPIMALGLLVSAKDKLKYLKPLYISGGIYVVLCLFFLFGGPSFFDFTNPGDARYAQMGIDPKVIIADRQDLLFSDSLRSLIIGLLCIGLIWAFIKSKINWIIFTALLGVVTVGELIQVDKRYINSKDFVSDSRGKAYATPRPVDEQILKDTDPNFRVLDATIDLWNSSRSSYFHKTIGGYHPAKLQRFEDLKIRHLSGDGSGRGVNMRVVNMLNTKYIIQPGANNVATPSQNPAALGNAWFVNNIQVVNSANEEIDALNQFDPAGDVIVHTEFSDYVLGYEVQKSGTITLTSYKPNELIYSSNSSANQFAVFSEIWYGPDKGWQAYIDDQPVDHIRVNYALRGMKIPSGEHNIRFVFDPSSYKLGNTISMVCSLLFLVGFIAALFLFFRQKTKETNIDEGIERPAEASVVKKEAHTKASDQLKKKEVPSKNKKSKTKRPKK